MEFNKQNEILIANSELHRCCFMQNAKRYEAPICGTCKDKINHCFLKYGWTTVNECFENIKWIKNDKNNILGFIAPCSANFFIIDNEKGEIMEKESVPLKKGEEYRFTFGEDKIVDTDSFFMLKRDFKDKCAYRNEEVEIIMKKNQIKKILHGKICQYCKNHTEYLDSKYIYGRSYGMVYLCKNCDAWVGVHKGTNEALGRVANKELRYWKKEAHKYFDKIWKSGKIKRSVAYKWLSEKLNCPTKLTHIGMFDVYTCKKIVEICKLQLYNGDKS